MMKPESMAADLAAAFEPSAAAGAINAVIVPPTSAAGLEDGVEHMEIDKKSDDDWMIADPVPLTETEMVGSFLQDQEKKDPEEGERPTKSHRKFTVDGFEKEEEEEEPIPKPDANWSACTWSSGTTS